MQYKRIFSWLSWLEHQSKIQLDYGKPYVIALGCFGVIGHPLWYVYWHYIDPRHAYVYENLGLRLLGMISSLLLILLALNKLPNPLKKYPSLTYVLILAYNLPFIEAFFLLKKSAGDPSYLTYAMTFVATLIIFSVFTGFIIFILFTFLVFC